MARAVDEQGIGRRVSEAREAAGMTQGELATLVAIERSAVNKIERGTRRVTAFELSEIARVLGRRMEWFLTEPSATIVAHRLRAGTSRQTIDARLEGLAREVEFLTSVGADLSFDAYDVKPVPTSGPDAELLAHQVRAELGLDLGPIVNVAVTAERLGLLVFSESLGADAADGGSLLLESGGVALINSSADVGRRRITTAHEIGHYVVADDYTVDFAVQQGGSDRESLLDRFARALLCPAEAVRRYWTEQLDRYENQRSAALRSASYWRIDFATLARRLLELEIIDVSATSTIRDLRAVKSDFIELSLHVPTDLEGQCLPRRFELAVLDLYRRETISSARALDLLQGIYADEDLPDRPVNPESATWQVVW